MSKPNTSKNTTMKLSKIHMPPDWNRAQLGDLSGLIASITQEGQLQPILVRMDEATGKVYLVDGRRRYAALQAIKADAEIKIIDAPDHKTAFLKSMVANLEREDNTTYDIARSFDKLVNTYNMTNEDVARACGKTPGYVSQHVTASRLAQLHPPLLSAFRKNTVPLSFFRYLVRLDPVVDLKFFLRITDAVLKGLSAQDAGDRIGMYIDKQRQKAVAKAKQKGVETEAPTKKGAAAHKKQKAGPKFRLTDYKDPGIKKLMRRVPRESLIEMAVYSGEKLVNSSSQSKQRYYQGMIDGLEYGMGLVEED